MKTLFAKSLINRPNYYVSIALEFKWTDLWIGVYPKPGRKQLDIWLCLLPCLPIHLRIYDGR